MLAAAAASSSGFVLAPAFVDADGNVTREYGSLAAMQRDALRWTLPRDPEDDGGLGGSLTFAIDPMLCARLDFRDRVGPIAFNGCNDVTFTTYRVFDTWADNHRSLRFVDVSRFCEQTHQCAGAEFVLTAATDDEDAELRGEAATVRLRGAPGAPLWTTADAAGDGRAISNATVVFSAGPPVQQRFARRGSALLGAIGRRFSGQVEMGVGVV